MVVVPGLLRQSLGDLQRDLMPVELAAGCSNGCLGCSESHRGTSQVPVWDQPSRRPGPPGRASAPPSGSTFWRASAARQRPPAGAASPSRRPRAGPADGQRNSWRYRPASEAPRMTGSAGRGRSSSRRRTSPGSCRLAAPAAAGRGCHSTGAPRSRSARTDSCGITDGTWSARTTGRPVSVARCCGSAPAPRSSSRRPHAGWTFRPRRSDLRAVVGLGRPRGSGGRLGDFSWMGPRAPRRTKRKRPGLS